MTTTPANDEHPHSPFGASKASMWRVCAGSIGEIEKAIEEKKIPAKSSSSYSEEGTIAHDFAAKVLTGECVLDGLPEENRLHLAGYIAHCREVEKSGGPKAEIYNESVVNLFYRPQDVGTVDHAVICSNFIHITDLKYGAGVKVEATENDQAKIYAISFIQDLEIMQGVDFDNDLPVFITIHQPRHYSFNGDPDTWETTVGALREDSILIEADYKESKERNGDLTPSEKGCFFCPIKSICEARAKTSFGGLPAALDVTADFDIELDTKAEPPKAKEFDKGTLTAGQIAWICEYGGEIKKIIDDVAKGETERLLDGGEIHSMKLIKGKLGNRTWLDEEAAEKAVRGLLGTAEAYKPRQFITAPQALGKLKALKGELSAISLVKFGLATPEAIKKSKTQCLIHRPDGKPKLVPVGHPAEAMVFSSVEDDFENEVPLDDLM